MKKYLKTYIHELMEFYFSPAEWNRAEKENFSEKKIRIQEEIMAMTKFHEKIKNLK